MTDKNDLLKQIKKIVHHKDPLSKVFLFGSRARGTMQFDSDWDILILLNKDEVTLDMEYSITDPLYDLELKYGEVISTSIYSEKEWNSKYRITPFYSNVMSEGKLL
jgi:uncharacterized protein